MIIIKNKNIYILIILLILIDQISKIIFLKISGDSSIGEIENNVAYRIMISIIAIVLILRYINSNNSYIKNDTKIVLSIGISGIAGNMIDLIWNKNVISFINVFGNVKINLAYIFILIAWVGMAIVLTKNTKRFIIEKGNKEDGKKANKSR